MLKSLCVKINNKNINNYLLKNFQEIDLDNIYVSKYTFKLYKNIIIHYTGNNLDIFLKKVALILSDTIIKFYEKKIIERIISNNYFYFNDIEQKNIFNICEEYLSTIEIEELLIKKEAIFLQCLNYLLDNKSLILDGFVNFRLTNYVKILDSVVDISVNKFVIDREYTEFIDLLKMYIDSKDYGCNIVHLIYKHGESILLDEFKNVIHLDNTILNNKFLSDISFSSNDYALNSLITLLPKTIYIHVVDISDEFINTLKLIFDNRVFLCSDCDICEIYRWQEVTKKK